jgi:hypothetical protein
MADSSETISNRLAVEFADGTADLTRAASLPGVPPPTEDVAALARSVRALKAVVDTLTGSSGSVLDKALTSRDLLNDDVFVYTPSQGMRAGDTTINVVPGGGGGGGSGYEDPRPVLSTPPTPENLTVQGAFTNVILDWDLLDYRNHAYTEVLRYTSDNLAMATVIGTAVSNQYVDATAALNTTYYYWVRAVNLENTTGAVNATAGTPGGRLLIGNLDLGDAVVLANNIASGQITPIMFANGTTPVFMGAALPALPNALYPAGAIFITTTNSRLYRSTGTTWTAQVDGADLIARTVSSASMITGTITAGSGVLANAAVTNAIIADLAVDNAKIAEATIQTAKIADLAVTGAKIANLTVTDAKIVNLSGDKINANSITADKIDSRNLTIKDASGNVILSASQNLDWSRLGGIKPKTYRVVSRGLGTNGAPLNGGLYDESNALVAGPGRSYSLALIDRTTGGITSQTYDVYGAGADAAGRDAAALAAALNATTSSQVIVLFTYDEPSNLRTTGGLPAAIYKAGGTPGIFESTNFLSRGAYMLISYGGGVGMGNALAEKYAGSGADPDLDGPDNAWIDLSFTLQNGNVVVSGGSGLFQINSDNVSTYIAAAAIDYARIASVDAGTISTGTLSANRIAAGSLNADKITSRTITTDRIQVGAVTKPFNGGGYSSFVITSNTVVLNQQIGSEATFPVEAVEGETVIVNATGSLSLRFDSTGLRLYTGQFLLYVWTGPAANPAAQFWSLLDNTAIQITQEYQYSGTWVQVPFSLGYVYGVPAGWVASAAKVMLNRASIKWNDPGNMYDIAALGGANGSVLINGGISKV